MESTLNVRVATNIDSPGAVAHENRLSRVLELMLMQLAVALLRFFAPTEPAVSRTGPTPAARPRPLCSDATNRRTLSLPQQSGKRRRLPSIFVCACEKAGPSFLVERF